MPRKKSGATTVVSPLTSRAADDRDAEARQRGQLQTIKLDKRGPIRAVATAKQSRYRSNVLIDVSFQLNDDEQVG